MSHSLPVFIHPGFGKTATTTLQDNLFINHPEVECIGRPQSGNAVEFRDNLLRNMDHYDESRQQDFLRALTPSKEKRVCVFSDEVVATKIYENQAIASRMKTLFPQAKIVFTIRNQYTIIPSYYSNHGRILKKTPAPYHGAHVGFNEWFDYCRKHQTNSYLDFIRYRPMIKIFEELYDKEAIKVFLFEDIVNNQDDFALKLSEFLGINSDQTRQLLQGKRNNPRNSEKMVKYQFIRQKFLPGFSLSSLIPGGTHLRKRFQNFLDKGKGYAPVITQEQKNFILQLCKDDNRALAQDYNLDLEKWNYPL